MRKQNGMVWYQDEVWKTYSLTTFQKFHFAKEYAEKKNLERAKALNA